MSEYPKPTAPQPDIEALEDQADDGEVEATDGCIVEPDGECEHGFPSWLVYLGMI